MVGTSNAFIEILILSKSCSSSKLISHNAVATMWSTTLYSPCFTSPSLGSLFTKSMWREKPLVRPDTTHRGETAKVDADADGDSPVLGCAHHLAHLVLVPKVAGVQPQTIDAAFRAFQSQPVMKVDVRDQGNVDLLLISRMASAASMSGTALRMISHPASSN